MYHYTESGLDNVWLKNGYQLRRTRYGEAVSVEDVDGLTRALAQNLIDKKGQLSGQELRFLRVFLGMSQESLGTLLGVQGQSVSLWERKGTTPTAQEALVRIIAHQRLDGDCDVIDMLERINTVDRLVNQAIVAHESRRKWKTEAGEMPQELETA